jgi:hypothetical protein
MAAAGRRIWRRSAPSWSFILCALLMAWLAAPAEVARAEDSAADSAAVGKMILLNRKAMEEYQNLNFDEATKLLWESVDLGLQSGLTQHPMLARTYLTLGIITIGGLKQRESGMRFFRLALKIQPEIKVSRALANPEIEAAFNQVLRDLASGTASDDASAPGAGAPKLVLVHEPIRTSRRGDAISIEASTPKGASFETLILAYRPAGASVFMETKMQREAGGVFIGIIPGVATAGGQVAYYIEAQRAGGEPVASRGSSIDPMLVTLVAPDAVSALAAAFVPGAGAPAAAPEPAAKKGAGDQRLLVALSLGTGFGWTSGAGEVRGNPVSPSGLAWARLGHLAPEVGYLVTPRWLLSVQGRLQLVTGAAEFRPPQGPQPGVCGGDGICSPAQGAFAGLLKAAWFATAPTDAFRPYVSFSAGGGYLRHVAQSGNTTDCGAGRNQKCFDTFTAGPLLFGPGVGLLYRLTDAWRLVFELQGLIGAPKLAPNVDANLGIAFQL